MKAVLTVRILSPFRDRPIIDQLPVSEILILKYDFLRVHQNIDNPSNR
jgi:hypothetical protein